MVNKSISCLIKSFFTLKYRIYIDLEHFIQVSKKDGYYCLENPQV